MRHSLERTPCVVISCSHSRKKSFTETGPDVAPQQALGGCTPTRRSRKVAFDMSKRWSCVRLMTSLWFVTSLFAAAQNPPGIIPAQSPTTADLNKGAEAEILAAVAGRDKAFLAGDEKTVARFIAEDYLQTDVLGHVQDKSAWLKQYFEPIAAGIKSGEFRWARSKNRPCRCAEPAILLLSLA